MTYQAKMWVIGSKGVIEPNNLLQTIWNIPAWGISKFQWGSPYTHIAIVQNPTRAKLRVWEAVAGGVKYHRWRPEGRKFDLFYVPCTKEQLLRAHSFLVQQQGKSYDFLGLGGFIWRSNKWQDDSKWFCSELAAAAMEWADFDEGPNFSVVRPHQMSPVALLTAAKGPYSLQEVRDEFVD